MNKALRGDVTHNRTGEDRAGSRADLKLDWRKRMSDHVAYALLVYTGLQIFVTMQAVHGSSGSILPYLALVVLVGAIIPACRLMESRWSGLSDAQAADLAFERQFRRDRLILWACALGLPFVLIGSVKAIQALF